MTERTIEHVARELAGEFYDVVRSAESRDEKVQISRRGRVLLQIEPKLFAKTFPTVRDYLAGRRHGFMAAKPDGIRYHIDDGKVYQTTPGWLHFYDAARAKLTEMLGMGSIHDNLKKGIYDAILEDREKDLRAQLKGQTAKIPQRRLPV